MRIFVTGCKGQLGRALDGALEGVEHVGCDLPEVDVTERRAVGSAIAGYAPHVVIHAAAWTHVDGCARDPQEAYRVNALGTQNVALACAESGAAIPACPVTATVKHAKDNVITKTVDRTGLYEAQTPQIFSASLLKKAYENLENLDKSKISDDSQLVEALGQKVKIVETDSSNIKITRPSDIAVAEAIIKSRPKPVPKGPVGPYIEAQW